MNCGLDKVPIRRPSVVNSLLFSYQSSSQFTFTSLSITIPFENNLYRTCIKQTSPIRAPSFSSTKSSSFSTARKSL